MIRGGEGHNARIRQEAKEKDRQDLEWFRRQLEWLLDREAARDVERNRRLTGLTGDYRPDETDTFRDRRDERDWDQAEREYHRFMHYE